jgi:hypothetical protein
MTTEEKIYVEDGKVEKDDEMMRGRWTKKEKMS